MKAKLILFMILLSAITGSAQLRWGAEAGVNISRGLDTNKTKAGFNLGGTAEYSFTSHWFMDASLKLSSQPCGDKNDNLFANPSSSNATYGYSSDYTPYYLTLPVRAGYKLSLRPDATLSLSAGPAIGVGLFGKGKISTIDNGQTLPGINTNSIFSNGNNACFSSSRFEYGASIRLGLELKKHYTLGAEYNIFHIAGDKSAIDNINIFSINIGYKF